MTINMYQADRNFVTPANDASLYSALARDYSGVLNRGNKFVTSITGLSLTVGTGQALIQGRLVEITVPETITLPANSNGNICLVVDLTKTNDVSGSAGDIDYAVTVNQVYVSAVTGTLTQDDLNNGGFVYELPIASFTSSATTATLSAISNGLNQPLLTKVAYTGWFSDYTTATPVVVAKTNGVVSIFGYAINSHTITSNNTLLVNIATLPVGFRPVSDFIVTAWGSGTNQFLLKITPDGVIAMGRYGNADYTTTSVGSWLNMSATFVAGN